MIFCRVLRRKRLLKLFEELLKYYNTRQPEVYKKKKYVLWFVLSYMTVESLAVVVSIATIIHSYNLDLTMVVHRMIVFIIPVAFIVLMPVSLENQYAVSCTILAEAFDKLNDQLDKMIENFHERFFEDDLKIFKRDRNEIMHAVKMLNREYGFELFLLSNTLLMVAVYVSNDVILMVNFMKIDSAMLWYKLVFNFYSLGGLAVRLCWICYETEQLNLKVI